MGEAERSGEVEIISAAQVHDPVVISPDLDLGSVDRQPLDLAPEPQSASHLSQAPMGALSGFGAERIMERTEERRLGDEEQGIRS